jgi:hypothetical protein
MTIIDGEEVYLSLLMSTPVVSLDQILQLVNFVLEDRGYFIIFLSLSPRLISTPSHKQEKDTD